MSCKNCGVCGQLLPLDNFCTTTKTLSGMVYHHSSCKTCRARDMRVLRILLADNAKPPTGTPCACCGRIDVLVLDHDHHSGNCRGWICKQCNISIGGLGDCRAGVERALRYLIKADNGGNISTSGSSISDAAQDGGPSSGSCGLSEAGSGSPCPEIGEAALPRRGAKQRKNRSARRGE